MIGKTKKIKTKSQQKKQAVFELAFVYICTIGTLFFKFLN